MKKSEKLSASFGLTQEEMAWVLNIGRSHWSMYELGTRSLPTYSLMLLSKITMHLDSPETAKKRAVHAKTQQGEKRKHLERLLRENKYEQLSLAKKSDAHEKTREAALRRLHLVEFLSVYHAEKGHAGGPGFIPPTTKTLKNPGQDPSSLSLVYELRKEMLAFEQQLIESKLKAL